MIEIRLLVIPNAFKRQADDSDHHVVRVEGKFRRPVGRSCLLDWPINTFF